MPGRSLLADLSGVFPRAGQLLGNALVQRQEYNDQQKRRTLLDQLSQNQDNRAERGMQMREQEFAAGQQQDSLAAMLENFRNTFLPQQQPEPQKFNSVGALEAYALQNNDSDLLNRIMGYKTKLKPPKESQGKTDLGFDLYGKAQSGLSDLTERESKERMEHNKNKKLLGGDAKTGYNYEPYGGFQASFQDSSNVIAPLILQAANAGEDPLNQLLQALSAGGVNQPERFGQGLLGQLGGAQGDTMSNNQTWDAAKEARLRELLAKQNAAN